MTTLEARYTEKIAAFGRQVAEARAAMASTTPGTDAYVEACRALEAAEEAETVYMLDVAPFIEEYTSSTPSSATAEQPPSRRRPATGLDKFVQATGKTNRNEIFQRYLQSVEHDMVAGQAIIMNEHDSQEQWYCRDCDVTMMEDARESRMTCPQCAVSRPYIGFTTANMSYQEEISANVVSSFSYKRLNHFSEWLNSIQAKATTDIPEDVIDAIKAEFKKSRTAQRKEITAAKVRQYLKKLNLNKLYEHSQYICTLINGVPAPKLEHELEEQLKHMFVAIQEPFQRAIEHTPRKNFLSYSYVLYKFCELLGRDDLLCHFSLLKSSEKLYQQDVLWRKICTDVGWQFIRSV